MSCIKNQIPPVDILHSSISNTMYMIHIYSQHLTGSKQECFKKWRVKDIFLDKKFIGEVSPTIIKVLFYDIL